MTKNSKIAGLVLGSIFAATALTAANDAMALDAGQCLPMAQMNQALVADGQRTLIIGNRTAINKNQNSPDGVDIKYFVNTVTSNADGSLGYQLEGNNPRDVASSEVCIRAKLSDVRLYDARISSIPNEAYLGGKFNEIVDENASKGTRPMVVANTVFGNGATLHNGLPIVVFGNVSGRSASVTTLATNGDPQMLVLMSDTDYTPFALQKLDNSKLASLSR